MTLLERVLDRLVSAPTSWTFLFRCQGCGEASLNPIRVQNHRAFACNRYMAYWRERLELQEEYLNRRDRENTDVRLELESRERALQSLYAAGWKSRTGPTGEEVR